MNKSLENSDRVEKILNLMEKKLNYDLTEKIIQDVYKMHNMRVIKIQKNLKHNLNLEFLVQNEVILANEFIKFLINLL